MQLTEHSYHTCLAGDGPGARTSGSGHPAVISCAASDARPLPFDTLQQFALAEFDPDQHVQHGDDRHRADEEQEAGHLEGMLKVTVFDLAMDEKKENGGSEWETYSLKSCSLLCYRMCDDDES